jgi:hypothetical protein
MKEISLNDLDKKAPQLSNIGRQSKKVQNEATFCVFSKHFCNIFHSRYSINQPLIEEINLVTFSFSKFPLTILVIEAICLNRKSITHKSTERTQFPF